jgi:hypothetical protein
MLCPRGGAARAHKSAGRAHERGPLPHPARGHPKHEHAQQQAGRVARNRQGAAHDGGVEGGGGDADGDLNEAETDGDPAGDRQGGRR